MLHDELQLLEAAVGTLDRLVRVIGRATRSLLGLPLVGPTEAVDLLPQTANFATERIDDRVELRVEVIGVVRETRRLFRGSKYRSGHRHQHPIRSGSNRAPTEVPRVHRDGVVRRDQQRADAAPRQHLAPIGMKTDHRAVVVERAVQVR